MKVQSSYVLVLLFVMFVVVNSPTANVRQSGKVMGQATDPNGAVIPGVRVKVIGEETEQEFSVEADYNGSFTVSGVPPGTYTVQLASPGFKGYSRKGVIVQKAQTVVIDIVMDIGPETESVVVLQEDILAGSTRGTGREVIGLLVGEWSLEANYYTPWPDAPQPEKIRGSISSKWGLDGLVLTQLWSVKGSPEETGERNIFLALFGAPSSTGVYRLASLGTHNEFQILEGSWQNNKLVFKFPDTSEGKAPSMEITVKRISESSINLRAAVVLRGKVYHFFDANLTRR